MYLYFNVLNLIYKKMENKSDFLIVIIIVEKKLTLQKNNSMDTRHLYFDDQNPDSETCCINMHQYVLIIHRLSIRNT